MAQGKLSNRQRMINMMYLVLLAILALNVSPEVLDAFTRVRQQLKLSAEDVNQGSMDFISSMKAEIDREIKNEGKRDNEGLKDTLDQIRARTMSILSLIAEHNQEMEKMAKYDEEEGDYTFKDEAEKNYRYWMGNEEANDRRGNGAAMPLRDSIDGYFAFLNRIYNSQMMNDSLKVTPKTLRDPENKSDDKTKKWEQYTFEGPVIGNMATLEALKLEMLKEEKKLLDLLNSRFSTNHTYIPDTIKAISAPVSQIVPAGLQFQTRLFVGMVSSQVKPEFMSSSGNIALDEDGNSAVLTIPANGRSIPNGQKEGRQSYQATIKVPTATGKFEELTIKQEFIVRKPEVQITSAAVQNLYFKCGNTVNIDVPALGNLYDPVVEASRAVVKQSSQSRKRFIIIPEGRESVVNVSSRVNGQLMNIDNIKYNVIAPPKTLIEFFVNNRPYMGTTTVRAGSRVEVRLKADPEFARLMPDDAKYRIGQIDILLKTGLTPASLEKTISTRGQNALNKIDLALGTVMRQAKPGDKIYVQLKDISRVNFRDELVPDNRFTELERTIPIVISH